MKLKFNQTKDVPPPLLEIKEGEAGKIRKLPYPKQPEVKPAKKPGAQRKIEENPLFLEGKEGEILYREQPEISIAEKPKGSNWEKLVGDITEKDDPLHTELNAVFLNLPPGSPLISFLEKEILEKYAEYRENPKEHEDSQASLAVSVLVHTLSFLLDEQALVAEYARLAKIGQLAQIRAFSGAREIGHTTEGALKKIPNPQKLSSLPVRHRLKTEFVPQPIFLGLQRHVELDSEELKMLSGLNELQLFLLEHLCDTFAKYNFLTEHPVVQFFQKLDQIDSTPDSIHPECRAELLAIYPYWYRKDFNTYHLEKYLKEHRIVATESTATPANQAQFLLRLKAEGGLLPAGLEKGGVALQMTGPVGRVVENLMLSKDNGQPENQTKEEARKFLIELLAPFKQASRELNKQSAPFTTPADLAELFKEGGLFHPLIDRTYKLLAAAYLQRRGFDLVEVDEDQEQLAYPFPEQSFFLELEKLAGQDAFNILDSFPNFYVPQDARRAGDNQQLIESVVVKLKEHHYQDVLRCVLLCVMLANILEEKESIRIPGRLIRTVKLTKQNSKAGAEELDPETTEEELTDFQDDTVDAIVLPQEFKPLTTASHRLENIVGEEKTPLDLIEIKSVLSLWQARPPQKLRQARKSNTASDERQVSNYARIIAKNYPNLSLNKIHVYYITFSGTRVLTYQSDKNGELSLIKSRLE